MPVLRLVGRTAAAETDAWMSAKSLPMPVPRIIRGLVVKGGVIRPDNDANRVLYNKEVEPRSLLLHSADTYPRDAKIFLEEITRISPKRVEKAPATSDSGSDQK
jgi:lipid-binding SYLF domain-containing protein